ncbi:hypothetical protein [Streptomyces sp. NPDC047869]|uniref:hypothetical protein n=1 Tax=Streptomyces sp. NPDC047869 TaxID=3154709 RepID=UPI003454DAE8
MYATHALSKGAALHRVQNALGHKDARATRRAVARLGAARGYPREGRAGAWNQRLGRES